MRFFILDHLEEERDTFASQMQHKRALKKKMLSQDGTTCSWCGETQLKETTMDHVVPDSLGGPMTSYNLIPACRPCNSGRRNVSALDWYKRCLKKGLNPNGELIVSSLQQCLYYGDYSSDYDLYYVAAQLQSPLFAAILQQIGGPFSRANGESLGKNLHVSEQN